MADGTVEVVLKVLVPDLETETASRTEGEDELTALALAADPDSEAADDAVPFTTLGSPGGGLDLLPHWYMPAPAGVSLLKGWRRRVAWLIVISFLAILAAGLCSTEGVVVPA